MVYQDFEGAGHLAKQVKNVAQAADAIEAFVQEFKKSWIIARLGYRTPLEVLQELSCDQEVAD